MSHGPEFTAIVVVCVILTLGAATRHFSGRTGFPYTVALIVLGFAAGLCLDHLSGDNAASRGLKLLGEGRLISPNLIIFVFLPALVFESAFALDQHAFIKELGAFGLLAVPALVLSTAMVGGGMLLLTSGSWEWSWTAALVFGALISATDPVAVVAILRETGAPKRLGILVEGESLLNDGTAIVVFTVLVSLLASSSATFDLSAALIDFVRVVAGGVIVGFALAFIVSRWVGRIFNDPLVEITLTIVVAYLAMIIGEGYLHVSGVIAVVVCGLWLGGRARTSISPEVTGFLHHYWEMLTYLANTLIFFLAGLVISRHVGAATLTDVAIVLGAYVLVMTVRFAITLSFRPLLSLAGAAITTAEAVALSWSGLRGAVSLALGLIVSQNPDIDPTLRRQIVLVTAGVVLLTVLINGSTIGRLLSWLGFSERTPGEELAKLVADDTALQSVRARVDDLSHHKDFTTLPWSEVDGQLDARAKRLAERIETTRAELSGSEYAERLATMWRRSLAMERECYWNAFAEGTLGARALQILEFDLDTQLDDLTAGRLSGVDASARCGVSANQRRIDEFRARLGQGATRLQFDRLALKYDVSRSTAMAAEHVTDRLTMFGDDAAAAEVTGAYRSLAHAARERIEELRVNLPELTSGIESRLAHRIALNAEREAYRRLLKSAALSERDAKAALADVERRMKELLFSKTEARAPETVEVCRNLPMFATLNDEQLDAMATATKERILEPGEMLFQENDRGDSVYIITRGAARVVRDADGAEQVLDIAHTGDVLGEMAFFSGDRRNAGVRAVTTLTVGELDRDALAEVMTSYPTIRDEIWDAYVRHVLDNLLASDPRFDSLTGADRRAWIAERKLCELEASEKLPNEVGLVVLLHGVLTSAESTIRGTRALDLAELPAGLTAAEPSKLVILPQGLPAWR